MFIIESNFQSWSHTLCYLNWNYIQQFQSLTDTLMGMKDQISGIVDITAGINNSPEGKSHGFSYGFIVRFVDQAARATICHIQSTLRSLEAISKLPQCNGDASKVKESLVDMNFSFPTNNQSLEVLPPFKSRLNLASTLITLQFATILIFLCLVVFMVETDQFNATFQQPFAKRTTVVPLTHYDADKIWPRPTTTFSRHSNLPMVGSSSFIWLGQAESRSAPIGTPWPSTITVHLVSFPPLVFLTHGPLFCRGKTAIRKCFCPIYTLHRYNLSVFKGLKTGSK